MARLGSSVWTWFWMKAPIADGPRVFNRAGYRKGFGPDQRWFVFPETWKDEVCIGLDPTATARVLGEPRHAHPR